MYHQIATTFVQRVKGCCLYGRKLASSHRISRAIAGKRTSLSMAELSLTTARTVQDKHSTAINKMRESWLVPNVSACVDLDPRRKANTSWALKEAHVEAVETMVDHMMPCPSAGG